MKAVLEDNTTQTQQQESIRKAACPAAHNLANELFSRSAVGRRADHVPGAGRPPSALAAVLGGCSLPRPLASGLHHCEVCMRERHAHRWLF
eukprot:scaffold17544_cov63-Phaeocystis_antarctica.AAC.7